MTKFIIQKSHREVSLVEQYTIDCEYLAYFLQKKSKKLKRNPFFDKKRCYAF